MNVGAKKRREQEKRAALLLLYIYDNDLIKDFTEFYKKNKDRPIEEVEKELQTKKT